MTYAGLPWIRRLIYFPDAYVPPIEEVLSAGEEVAFTTDDGLQLAAWFVRGRRHRAAAVLVLPGNAGTRADRAPLAAALAARGYAALLCDYRGYGRNPGKPSEEGLSADARAAQVWLRSHASVDPDRIVLFGESLGSGVAVRLATEAPPAVMVLRSTFTSLGDLARVHYPWIPTALLPDRYPTIDQIGAISVPTLVIAGERDQIVPLANSVRLFHAANEPKRLVIVRPGTARRPAHAQRDHRLHGRAPVPGPRVSRFGWDNTALALRWHGGR